MVILRIRSVKFLMFLFLIQRCKLAESLHFNNGTPRVPVFGEQAVPGLFMSKNTEELIPKSDTKLRIFSGTANPLLAQVYLDVQNYIYFDGK